MKAYLLKALMDNVKLNGKELVDFLDPDKARKAAKRPLSAASDAKATLEVKPLFAIYMGSDPSQFLSDKEAETGVVVQGYVSSPLGPYKTGFCRHFMKPNQALTRACRRPHRVPAAQDSGHGTDVVPHGVYPDYREKCGSVSGRQQIPAADPPT